MSETIYNELVDEFITQSPDEIIFHCLSITRSAINSTNEATKEALLFVLMEKLLGLYQLTE